ncbi:myelin protein P0 isoform X1 [Perca flavescens]|uniref:myelin protein P0 isoform X1 n=1 Tax=Perca flavescens TaxID=8167 RepID=UPI00106EF791|nr:myelin protein P0 isoform X1 [Perca flavescens]
MLTFLALASVVLLGIVPEQSQAIMIYTGWERHALVGGDIRLSCSFFSWRWTSEEVTFSWTYRPDGARDSISIFHYTGGEAYVDNKGPFRDRLEFVGNPGRRDGSILIKNLDYNDNGTFTCDAKNPPDIVGRPSSVRLLVFEKVPIQAGVITGAIIGVVLGLLVLIVVIYYLMRFLVARRVFSLSVSKHGKKKKEGSQQRQLWTPPPSLATPSPKRTVSLPPHPSLSVCLTLLLLNVFFCPLHTAPPVLLTPSLILSSLTHQSHPSISLTLLSS